MLVYTEGPHAGPVLASSPFGCSYAPFIKVDASYPHFFLYAYSQRLLKGVISSNQKINKETLSWVS